MICPWMPAVNTRSAWMQLASLSFKFNTCKLTISVLQGCWTPNWCWNDTANTCCTSGYPRFVFFFCRVLFLGIAKDSEDHSCKLTSSNRNTKFFNISWSHCLGVSFYFQNQALKLNKTNLKLLSNKDRKCFYSNSVFPNISYKTSG